MLSSIVDDDGVVLDAGQIEDLFNDMELISGTGNETMAALVGGDLPESIEEYNTMQTNMTRYEDLVPEIMTADIQNMAQNGELGLDDLEAIGASPVPMAVVADIVDSNRISTKWDEDILTSNDPGAMIDTKLFGSTGCSARDVTWAIQNSDEETQGLLNAIFDANGDGKISDEEAANIDPDRAKEVVGLGGDNQSLIDAQGKWSFDDVIKKLEGSVVDGNYEKGARTSLRTKYKEEEDAAQIEIDTFGNKIIDTLSKYGVAKLPNANDMKLANESGKVILDINKRNDENARKYPNLATYPQRVSDMDKEIKRLQKAYESPAGGAARNPKLLIEINKINQRLQSLKASEGPRYNQSVKDKKTLEDENKNLTNIFKSQKPLRSGDIRRLTRYSTELNGATDRFNTANRTFESINGLDENQLAKLMG